MSKDQSKGKIQECLEALVTQPQNLSVIPLNEGYIAKLGVGEVNFQAVRDAGVDVDKLHEEIEDINNIWREIKRYGSSDKDTLFENFTNLYQIIKRAYRV